MRETLSLFDLFLSKSTLESQRDRLGAGSETRDVHLIVGALRPLIELLGSQLVSSKNEKGLPDVVWWLA